MFSYDIYCLLEWLSKSRIRNVIIRHRVYTIRRHQIFLGGSSDENEKVLGKFLARLWHAKKGVPKFCLLCWAFFVMEALKTSFIPLNLPNDINFLKKGPLKFLYLQRAFFQNFGRTILQIWSDKRGGKNHTLPSPR